jgi:hypothetical protein
MLFADATHAGRGHFPPSFHRQEAMSVHIEGKALPLARSKAVVLWQCTTTWVGGSAACTMGSKCQVFRRGAERMTYQLDSLAWRGREMDSPIEEGARKGARRQASGQAGKAGAHRAINVPR